jgi:hypothetical protein
VRQQLRNLVQILPAVGLRGLVSPRVCSLSAFLPG